MLFKRQYLYVFLAAGLIFFIQPALAESEEALAPFKLGVAGKIKAFFGKYLW